MWKLHTWTPPQSIQTFRNQLRFRERIKSQFDPAFKWIFVGNCVIKWSNEVHYSVFIIVKQSTVCSTQGSNPQCCSHSIISAVQELPDLFLSSWSLVCHTTTNFVVSILDHLGGWNRSQDVVYLAGNTPRATSWVWNVLAKSQPPQLYHMGPDRTGVTSISTLIPTQILRGSEEDILLEL